MLVQMLQPVSVHPASNHNKSCSSDQKQAEYIQHQLLMPRHAVDGIVQICIALGPSCLLYQACTTRYHDLSVFAVFGDGIRSCADWLWIRMHLIKVERLVKSATQQ